MILHGAASCKSAYLLVGTGSIDRLRGRFDPNPDQEPGGPEEKYVPDLQRDIIRFTF